MTTHLSPQEQTYQALRRAMLRAQEAGVRIVCEANDVIGGGRLVGCCAIAAHARFKPPSDFALVDVLGADGCQDIIRGFDGVDKTCTDTEWYDVGARLRDEFQPITATALERELEAT